MIIYADFEEYLVYDEDGNVIGIIQEAPVYAKMDYRNWYTNQQDLERLKELFTNNY